MQVPNGSGTRQGPQVSVFELSFRELSELSRALLMRPVILLQRRRPSGIDAAASHELTVKERMFSSAFCEPILMRLNNSEIRHVAQMAFMGKNDFGLT